jgi:iron complex transport system permease protein
MPRPLTWLLLALAPASIGLALGLGSTPLGVDGLWRVLTGADTGLDATVVLELRLPRALNAFAVGGLLALSGVLLQVLLRNPLADPYILGVSGGAAVAALLTLVAGLSGAWVTGNAFAGALASMLLVFGLARVPGEAGATRLLLTGVVVAAGWGALISLILAVSPQAQLHGLLFWLLGDLSRPASAGWAFWALVAGLALAFGQARALNLLARGETVAASLGAHIGRLRALVYVLASLLTAAAVSLAGTIGFVGLIVPHALRLLGATDHRRLLPDAVLAGGSFLVIADTLARSLLAPQQLPVGVITALLGVPVFLVLLHRGMRR